MSHTLCFNGHHYFLDGEKLNPQRSQKVRNHSPDGFSHGYSGSGPSQLALAIVLELTDQPEGYQDFRNRVIAPLPHSKTFEVKFNL